MESDNRHFARPEVPLDEPHFDEEATLLSARPVIPLREVAVRTNSQHRLTFALAIAVALMVGALGTMVIYKQGAQKDVTSTVQNATTATENSPEPSVGQAEGGMVVEASETPTATTEDNPTTIESNKRQTLKSTNEATPEPGRAPISKRPPDPVELEREEFEREMHRAERREERRARRREGREANRETRDRNRQSSDDLLRIREIFEGSPRP